MPMHAGGWAHCVETGPMADQATLALELIIVY